MAHHLPEEPGASSGLIPSTDDDGKLRVLSDVFNTPGLTVSGTESIGNGVQTGTITHGDTELTAPYLVLAQIVGDAADAVLSVMITDITNTSFDWHLDAATSTANYSLHWFIIRSPS